MKDVRIRSASGQFAEYLKEQIRHRKWTNTMPGESWMVTHLQVGRGTVRAALAQLEEEGILSPCGQGKRRRIVMSEDAFATRRIRVRIFLYEKQDRGDIDSSSLLAELLEAGMDADFAGKSLKELGMQVDRVARYVKQNPADAWVVTAASRAVLEWFSGQPTPSLAMYGRHNELPIAAAYPIMVLGQTAAVQRLIDLGHKRIVMLTREERRKPQLSRPEQMFIDQLEAAGIATGDYNLPDWEESREGLGRLLDHLFRFSAPTAMYFQEAQLFIAARSHLANRGIVAPRDVSLVVSDHDPCFAWHTPIPSHIHWDYRSVVRRVVRWVNNVAAGKKDQRKIGTESEFVEGGTIGPVPRGSVG
jgi:DNA-binding transcriptional regulator YhcF (GntR family)